MKVGIVLGTRPEIIKMSPIIRELQNRRLPFFILHTGQHYSQNMDKIFFEQLRLPSPDYNLHSGSGSHAEETAKIMVGVEGILHKAKPDVVLVEGDTNTVLAGSLTAAKMAIKLGHVEAGLRSYDRRMPEEINRIVADHVSNLLFAPTEGARGNLLKEGVDPRLIRVTGNTIVDALKHDLPLAERIELGFDVSGTKYSVLTLHRQENVDDRARLRRILDSVSNAGEKLGIPVIYPVHPRTRKRISEFGLRLGSAIKAVPPLGYLQFLKLLQGSKIVFTDSGGVQEEACVLKVPCVTIRDNTERPETMEVGSNVLTSANSDSILFSAKKMIRKVRTWGNPFGDGHAGVRIVNILSGKE